ncbi:type IV secretion system protein [Dyella sp.]|uniref:type IV secretion system protein n=1 Tax=Dyella sp. TaxID=1869338 RepID=UPI002ED34789
MGALLGSGFGAAPTALIDVTGATNFVFFATINDFLRKEIDIFQWSLLQRITLMIGSAALILLTLWILIQGYRIVTGQSREPMMGLVVGALRGGLIIGLATSMAAGSSGMFFTVTDGLSGTIVSAVTGSNKSVFQDIDDNLMAMEAAMAMIDTLNPGNDQKMGDAKDRAMWFTGIGIAGPGVVAGSMLLLNKIALALFIGFGPLFILCLLFPQTQSLFSKWLFYGIGTMFSLAVLSVMVDIAMRMVAAVTLAFGAKYLMALASGSSTQMEGINSMAMQQGGLGLLLSTLIVMAPPMAASFFQGTLASFAASSSFGQVGRYSTGQRAEGNRPAAMGGPPSPNSSSTQNNNSNDSGSTPQVNAGRHSGQAPAPAPQDTTKTGSDKQLWT